MFEIILSAVFVFGYIMIAMEHKWNLHKAITAASLGGVLWLLVALKDIGSFERHATSAIGGDIFNLIIFLLAAMTIVEVMAHYRFFDYIRSKILGLGLTTHKQFWVLAVMTFFLSAVLDNLTTTIVMIEIARCFFRGRNLAVTGAMVVIAANAGGAWSPIGDVTTIMLWLAEKFTAIEVITWAFIPSAGLALVSAWLLSRKLLKEESIPCTDCVVLQPSEKAVIFACLVSFFFPVIFSQLGLEPYFGLLFGLGFIGMLIALFRVGTQRTVQKNAVPEQDMSDSPAGLDTHLTVDFEKKLARVDLASLLFFSGVLLSVGALEHTGVLHHISELIFGSAPSITAMVIGNTGLGILSALVDNIPLTAGAMSIIQTTDSAMWVLLALTAGTGGSLLVIGSAAGVVAMGKIKELSFGEYIKIATFPAFVGYVVAVGLWLVQYGIFR